MDPQQFQYLALRLAEHGRDSVDYRTAINRAYYAAFHSGLSVLKGMGFSIPQNQHGHEAVYRHFNNSCDDDLEKVASKINDLYAKRIHADYRLERTDVEAQRNARAWVQLAGSLIESMNRICNGKKRPRIIDTIQDWKTKTGGSP